jgi:hypothetical protein
MSDGERSLYVALKRRYNQTTHNNGRIFLSQRDAAKGSNCIMAKLPAGFVNCNITVSS